MERKVRTTRRQRSKRSWIFSPFIIAQLAVIMVLSGVGAAFAFTPNTIVQDSQPWAGTSSITETANLDVTDYWFGYNTALTQVHSVTVEITNTDSSAHTTDIEAVILDGSSNIEWSDSASGVSCTASTTTTYTFTFTTDVAFSEVVTLNIVLTEQS
ncbi:MAG: hypothetical protein WC562_08830 [Dehalococcoidia bacterium]